MFFTAAQNEATLRAIGAIDGGCTVVKGTETTYGIFSDPPVGVLDGQGGSGGVQVTDTRVVIAKGRLTGIAADDGIGESITVDGVTYTVIGIGAPPGEPDGAFLELVLRG